jgi:hypothetical protein
MIVQEIKTCDERIGTFLKKQFKIIIQQGILSEVLMAHIHPLMLEERLPLVEEKINQILES